MFETIGNLITTGFWVVAIGAFVLGIILCIGNLITGTNWEKMWSIVGAILGVVAFFKMYDWTESIGWCLLVAGIVTGCVSNIVQGWKDAENNPPPRPEPGPSLGEIILKYERDKAVVKDALKELDREK